MNKEFFNQIIAFMENEENWTKGKYRFSMKEWINDTPCGTVCCIGGTAEIVAGLDYDSPDTYVGELMGLSKSEADELFYCWNSGHEDSVHDFHTDRPRAIQLLKDIRDGKVIFDKTEKIWRAA